MGSDRHYPEQAPARQIAVSDFWIDRAPATSRQFHKFINETGHVTFAELPPDAKDYPGALPHMLKAGSLIFGPNGYGLYDMIGNVWQWTADWYGPAHNAKAQSPCCAPENRRGASEEMSYDPRLPNIKIPRKVLKGGLHLCAPNYCRRYRPATRHAQPVDSSTSHIGFRCVIRTGSEECPTTPREKSQA